MEQVSLRERRDGGTKYGDGSCHDSFPDTHNLRLSDPRTESEVVKDWCAPVPIQRGEET